MNSNGSGNGGMNGWQEKLKSESNTSDLRWIVKDVSYLLIESIAGLGADLYC